MLWAVHLYPQHVCSGKVGAIRHPVTLPTAAALFIYTHNVYVLAKGVLSGIWVPSLLLLQLGGCLE